MSEHNLSLPTETIESTEGFLRCMGSDDYVMVFELDGKYS